ncbi:hypothetical protein FRC12_025162 [Ceratobasidium sp. 428]|nr:hypothetical protein FRC12_025162 [Ceratobasidium sp. 428]
MFAKLKHKSERARDAASLMFRSSSQKPSVIHLEYMSWDGLEALARSLSDKPGGFGGLRITIDRLSTCVGMFDAQCRTRLECSQLRIDINELFFHLARYISTPLLLPLHGSHERVARFARSLDCEIEPLLESKESLKDREVLPVNQFNKVLARYRRVRALFALFLMSENTMIWKLDNTEEAAAKLESFPYAPAAYYRYSGPDAVPRNGCTPKTREAVLQDLRDWVRYGKSQNIRWLNGTAGVGKTAVAYSVCDYLESTGKPFVSVFCSRQHPGFRDVNRIIPTISYQLAWQSLPFRCALSNGLEQDLDIARLPFDDQFKQLIATPLGLIGHTFMGDPVIVVDGIEECEDKDMIYKLLRVLVEQVRKLPIKLLISISPTRMTHRYMRSTPSERHMFELRLHEIDHTVARNDINTYLATRLLYLNLSTTDLKTLAQQSGASFIYATALVQYLGEANSAERLERLRWLLEASDPANPSRSDPDVQYSTITRAILHGGALDDSIRGEVLTLLRTAVHEGAPPTLDITVGMLELDFVRLLPTILSLLLPVLYVSDSDGSSLSLEKAFATYVLNRPHSDTIYQSPAQTHAQLTRGCFNVMMSTGLSFNVCDLESSCLLDREVPYLEERVKDAISPRLLYACLRWGVHLELAEATEDLCSQLEEFLSTRLLLWMEILILTNHLTAGMALLGDVREWLQRLKSSAKTIRLVEEACNFFLIFSTSPISRSTPHIYILVLQFWLHHGPFMGYYGHKIQKLISSTAEWPARLTQLSTTSDLAGRVSKASSAALETDTYELSGPDRHLKEAVAQPLSGHTDYVTSVAYSPEGTYIASSSWDNTIRIWDASSGKPVGQPLAGHTSGVLSIAYSPDGTRVVSGSADKTIRIWHARTGGPVGQPFIGHTDRVGSVAYSPDGAYIASGSEDKTIRIWDASTGTLVGQSLAAYTSYVDSVAYSPDGAFIVSGAEDNTIQIWDAHTGEPMGQPLSGHTKPVTSVAYSPSGAYIASGSYDETIRIWDAFTGSPVGQPFTGHTHYVESVAYSPDGAYIVSGSRDKTVRIWDAHTGRPVGPPLPGHSDGVNSVVYSSNGAYIVSGSKDRSICVWFAPRRPESDLVLPPTSSQRSAIEPIHPSNFGAAPVFTNRNTHTVRPNHSHIVNNTPKLQGTIDTSITASPYDWTLNEDGWLLGLGRERLLRVPPDLRDIFAPPRVKVILSNKPFVILDLREAKLGRDWQQCYNPT